MMTSAIPAAILTMAAITGQPRGEVLDFSASWCGPCQQMAPLVSKLERQGYPIRKVDVDTNRALAQKYGISSIPAFVLVVDGKEVTRVVGAVSEQQLIGMLSQIPNDPPVMTADRDTPPPSRTRESEPPRRSTNATSTQPVMALAEDAPRNPARTTTTESDEGPSARGLIGKLFNRDEPKEPAQTPAVVRGNIDSESPNSENVLPIRNPVEASVRLHVTINGQTQVGSGTSIDSREGQTIVATCGHLFEGWNERSKIEVDLFLNGEVQRYVGRMIQYDANADVGVVAIPTDSIVPTAEVATADARPQVDQPLVTIGCSGGAAPTQERVQVTALNYFEGPDNIECTGVPVQGRSGGGLFNRQGQIVGLCIAADAERQRGAYAGLLAIHDLLTAAGMSDIYKPASQTVPAVAVEPAVAVAENRPPVVSTRQPTALDTPTRTTPVNTPKTNAEFDPFAATTTAPASTTPRNTEVIVIVNQPNAPSKVVIIDRPSEKFLSYLDGQVAARQTPVQTNRVPAQNTTYPQASSRFTTPGQKEPVIAEASNAGERSRNASWQPTALARPFRPQQYIRSSHTRSAK